MRMQEHQSRVCHQARPLQPENVVTQTAMIVIVFYISLFM